MSLYIPNINLPPKGEKRLALFIGSDGVVDVYRSSGEATPYLESYVMETECIEVPEHGRFCVYDDLIVQNDAAPTIIPADGADKEKT